MLWAPARPRWITALILVRRRIGSKSMDMAVTKDTNSPGLSLSWADREVAVQITVATAAAASTCTRGTLTADTRTVRMVWLRRRSATSPKRRSS
jgi:hypothetical protein